jgi:hypothetical protein
MLNAECGMECGMRNTEWNLECGMRNAELQYARGGALDVDFGELGVG